MGPPEFSDISLPACHGLWTPADFPIQAFTDVLVLPSASVKSLGIRNNPISKLYQHFRARDRPYGLQDSLSTLHLFLFANVLVDSATGARLNTGGWLILARRGLSPRKICRASLGAGVWTFYVGMLLI